VAIITFNPDVLDSQMAESPRECAFFIIAHGDAQESSQIRWQVTVGADDSVQLETGDFLERLGGALFLTARERPTATEQPDACGWIRWFEAK
jgi:hypothetical protein